MTVYRAPSPDIKEREYNGVIARHFAGRRRSGGVAEVVLLPEQPAPGPGRPVAVAPPSGAGLVNTRAIVRQQLVKLFRTNRGWTQERAAEWYGCSTRSWRRYEHGERPVPTPLVMAITRRKGK